MPKRYPIKASFPHGLFAVKSMGNYLKEFVEDTIFVGDPMSEHSLDMNCLDMNKMMQNGRTAILFT